MSTITKEQADASYAYMSNEIDANAFFEKLASFGVRWETQADMEALYKQGLILKDLEDRGQLKQAGLQPQPQTRDNPFFAASLQRLTKLAGAVINTPEAEDAMLKQAALELVRSNELARNAALIFTHVANGGQVVDAAA